MPGHRGRNRNRTNKRKSLLVAQMGNPHLHNNLPIPDDKNPFRRAYDAVKAVVVETATDIEAPATSATPLLSPGASTSPDRKGSKPMLRIPSRASLAQSPYSIAPPQTDSTCFRKYQDSLEALLEKPSTIEEWRTIIALQKMIEATEAQSLPSTAPATMPASTDADAPWYSRCYSKLSACASGVKAAISSCFSKQLCQDISVADVFINIIALWYALNYAAVSQDKAAPAIGNGTATAFSIFSFICNFAQMKPVLASGLSYHWQALKTLMKGSSVAAGLWTTFSAFAAILPGTPLASASYKAIDDITSQSFIANLSKYSMWSLRSYLVFRSSLIIVNLLAEKLSILIEKYRLMKEGDRTAAQTIAELGLYGAALFIAVKYSQGQQSEIGDFSIANIFESTRDTHPTLTKALEFTGLVPLLALNINFITAGMESVMDMWNKPHGLLFFAGFLAAFTGYPGIALVVSHELIMKFIAYGAALLSNWASMMKLKFFSETTNKAFFAQGLEQLAHLITARLLEIRSKTGATNPEREEYDALSDLSKIVNKMIQNHREQTGEKSMLTTCTAKADRGLASGISGAVEYVGGALSSATTYCGSFLGWGTRASAAAESYSPV